MTIFPWTVLARAAPTKHEVNRRQSRKAFQQLWVAGTIGVFFTSLARNLPVHLSQTTAAYDTKYTLDVLVRYAYLIWLLGYFFMSALRNDRPDAPRTWRDMVFDVLESLVSLTAVYFLGFIIPVKDYGSAAYAAANGAVLFICVASLLLFHSRGNNRLRGFGAIISLIGLAASICFTLTTTLLCGFAVETFLLLWLLAFYIRIGVDE